MRSIASAVFALDDTEAGARPCGYRVSSSEGRRYQDYEIGNSVSKRASFPLKLEQAPKEFGKKMRPKAAARREWEIPAAARLSVFLPRLSRWLVAGAPRPISSPESAWPYRNPAGPSENTLRQRERTRGKLTLGSFS